MSPEQLHQSRTRRAPVDGIHPKPVFDIAGAKVAVIGLDPDGFSLARLAARSGFETTAFDADEVKVAQLEASDTGLPAARLSITADASALKDADIFILCAATPLQKNGRPDLSELQDAAATIGRALHQGALVVVASTVLPGVCEHVIMPALEKNSGLEPPRSSGAVGDFFFAHAPMLFGHTEQIVGAVNAESLLRTAAFYRALSGDEVRLMRSIKEAEAVRVAEDSFRDVNLALTGELAILFDRIGVDIVSVLNALVPDPSGSSAPRSGIGTPHTSQAAYYVSPSGHEHEIEMHYVANARRGIEQLYSYTSRVLSDALREKRSSLKGATVALLGSQDKEESAGMRLQKMLERKGAIVRAYDPEAALRGRDLKETLEDADAVVITSDHPMFAALTPMQFEELGVRVVVDARNCLDKDAFEKSSVLYRGIGRG